MSNILRRHLPCGDCGSSDALCVYDDGHTYCFSCTATHQKSPIDNVHLFPERPRKMSKDLALEIIAQPTFQSYRGIPATIYEKYNTYTLDDSVVFNYYDKDNKPSSQKVRSKTQKSMFTRGDVAGSRLFGANLFEAGGKYITVTEGEFDALAAFYLTGAKWPCVSIKTGAQGALKDIKENWEYLNSFEKIVLCFDNDEPGKQAAKAVALLFPPTKVKIVNLTEGKDANEYLEKGLRDEFVNRWWRAETYTPENVLASSSLKDTVFTKETFITTPYPFQGLNEKTYGMRFSELTTVIAESGIGKSQLLKEFMYHILTTTNYNIGGMFIEESVKDTWLSLASLHLGKRLNLPDVERTPEEEEKAYTDLMSSDRIWLYKHFGSQDLEPILNTIRYLAKACDCKFIFFDHISMLVSDQRNGDERKALDEIVTKLKTLTMELDIHLCMVSHINRGGSIRGTAGIEQLSNTIIRVTRDKTHEDESVRNTNILSIEKNRFNGDTGTACSLRFNKQTGKLDEILEINPFADVNYDHGYSQETK